jgi:hypothetical protein
VPVGLTSADALPLANNSPTGCSASTRARVNWPPRRGVPDCPRACRPRLATGTRQAVWFPQAGGWSSRAGNAIRVSASAADPTNPHDHTNLFEHRAANGRTAAVTLSIANAFDRFCLLPSDRCTASVRARRGSALAPLLGGRSARARADSITTNSRTWTWSCAAEEAEGPAVTRNTRRLLLTVALLAALAATAPGASVAGPACRGSHWVGAWATSPSNAASSTFVDQSLRLIVTPTLGGRRLRVRLANRLGTGGVTFSSAFVARRRAGAALVPGTSHRLRFGGRPRVTIGPGRERPSDPVRLRFHAFQDLAVSVHVQGTATGASQHLVALQTSYSTPPRAGNHAADGGAGAFTERLGSWPYLTDVDVRAPRRVGAIVALGDSITEGFPGPIDQNARYTDCLARRLAATARPRPAVQNAGISGNPPRNPRRGR